MVPRLVQRQGWCGVPRLVWCLGWCSAKAGVVMITWLTYCSHSDRLCAVYRSMQHCLAHGEDDIQHVEQDSAVSAGPCYDSTTAENIVDELMFGNAEMVCITYCTVQLRSFILLT